MQISEKENYQADEYEFLRLFYDSLFMPQIASEKIKYLRVANPTRILFYSLLIVFLAALGQSASKQSLEISLLSIFSWLFSVLVFILLAWLFRPRGVDIGSIFFFCAFAQSPLIFLGLAKLWENSVLPTTGPTILCYIWSAALWWWALQNSLQVGKLKSGILLFLGVFSPFIILIAALAIAISSLINTFN